MSKKPVDGDRERYDRSPLLDTTPGNCSDHDPALQDVDDEIQDANVRKIHKIYCEDDCDGLLQFIDRHLQDVGEGSSEEPGSCGKDGCDEPPGLIGDKCCVCGTQENVRRCGNCKMTSYCSKQCQKEHFPHHSKYCSVIVDLLKVETQKLFKDFSVRQVQIDFKTKKKMMKLVGEKPMLSCYLGGKQVDVLWDTGSMISIVDRKWIEQMFPGIVIHSVKEFLEEGLQVRAANSTLIDIDGVVLLDFSLVEGGESFLVPVIIAREDMAEPILGYNVIEHLITDSSEGREERLKQLETAIHSDGKQVSVDALAAVIEEKAATSDFLTEVKSPKSVCVPAGHKTQIKCRVKAVPTEQEQAVYFSPVMSEDDPDLVCNDSVSRLRRGHTNYVTVDVINKSKSDRWLSKGTVVGSIHTVSSVMPMMRMFNDGEKVEQGVDVDVGGVGVEEGVTAEGKVGVDKPKWDLSHLNEDQQIKLKEVLSRCEDIFSVNDSDIGEIKDFQMEINLTDNVPVTAAYQKIPPNLYGEVKNYIEDLRTNGWIRESYSSYSSPIVCVRKKDGSMRLCIDYRRLNAKTIPDSQPIPGIQDILDNLAGSKWFSTLDMSTANSVWFEECTSSLSALHESDSCGL